MWYAERMNKSKTTKAPQFSMCCINGRVQLPELRAPPATLSNLLLQSNPRSKQFQHNIRSYNMMFSFTSLGGKIETNINTGSSPSTFLLHGQDYHLLGSLLPEEGASPKFSQLYIYDKDNEVQNRIRAVR